MMGSRVEREGPQMAFNTCLPVLLQDNGIKGCLRKKSSRQRLAGRRDQPCVWRYLTWIPNHMTFGSHLALLLRFLIYQMAAMVDW